MTGPHRGIGSYQLLQGLPPNLVVGSIALALHDGCLSIPEMCIRDSDYTVKDASAGMEYDISVRVDKSEGLSEIDVRATKD